jgi:hypothetical protein
MGLVILILKVLWRTFFVGTVSCPILFCPKNHPVNASNIKTAAVQFLGFCDQGKTKFISIGFIKNEI